MSALPKKKLCWNCEGNVAIDIDNCPYCAVYLHASELEGGTHWNRGYSPSTKTEEIPAPPYRIQTPEDQVEILNEEESDEKLSSWLSLFSQLKSDLFPMLFLMAGSVFFLFGVVLLLFSQNGTLTLQWQESHGFYFLFMAFPLIVYGWKFLQQLEVND